MPQKTIVTMITEVQGQISALGTQIETASATETRIEQKVDLLVEAIQAGLLGLTQTLINIQNTLGQPPQN